MIIYINKGNPYGLKIEICLRAAGQDIPIEVVQLEDIGKLGLLQHLPSLELDDGTQLFSTDAIVKYLLPNEEPVELRDEWLEWCSTRLAPTIIQKHSTAQQEREHAEAVLNHLILQLEALLCRGSTFMIGDKPTSVDYSVWSFLAQDKKTLQSSKVIDWYNRVAEQPCVKGYLKDLKIDVSAAAKANKFGGISHIYADLPVGDNEPSGSNDSPSHTVETVTAAELTSAKESFVFVEQAKVAEPRTVLPKPGQRNILITSALPYVNNVPHLGNIIGCVLSADIFARFARTAGYNTLYIGGTDEYGTATETKAIAENLTPQQICDKFYEIHNNIYRWFGIGFDYFGRTSAPEHKVVVQEYFHELYGQGLLDIETVEQLLCQKCDRYLADRLVEGICPHPGCGYEDARGDQCDGCGKLVNATDLIEPRCKVCSTSPVTRESKQFFLNLPKVESKLTAYIDTVAPNWTNNARVITRSWLKEGLRPRCVTRDLKWGVSVPHEGFEQKVFYVWFDAVLGYQSITKKYTKEYRQWWQPTDKNVKIDLFQFMAKDNVPFHSVVLPSMMLGMKQEYTKVTHIMATEYLNYEDGKFSKSRGIGVFGNDAQDTGIPADVWRFYLASARPEGQDSSFSWDDLMARNNSELLNNLGNFINRALMFCEKNYNSTIGDIRLNDDDVTLVALINREIKGYIAAMEKAKMRDGIRHTLAISRHGNQYLQFQEPWKLLKGTDEQKERAVTVIGLSCNISCILASLLFPFMPQTARTIWTQVNVEHIRLNPEKRTLQLYLRSGHKIGKPAPLFVKIEQARLDELKKKYSGSQLTEANLGPKFTLITDAEAAITAQGNKVRELKKAGASKQIVEAEVNCLFDLKDQLTALQKEATAIVDAAASNADPTKIEAITAEIAVQGDKIRKMKAENVEKSVLLPEITKLNDLKNALIAAGGKPAAPPPSSSGKNKKKK